MRVIFMGTDKFAVPALEALINSEVELVCVITQPDRPKGRKLKLAFSPVKEVAIENNLTLHQPNRVREKEFIDQVLKPLKADVIVVAAFGQILPKAILDLPPRGCINIHPSLLPKFRGAAPIQRAIMEGEKETGVTIMFMDEGEDTGDIILQETMEIDSSDSAETLSQKLAYLSASLIQKTLRLAQSGTIPHQPQDQSKASYAPKLRKEDGLIDWKKSAFEIHNLIRGTTPWPGAYTTFREAIQLKIWESQIPESSHPSAHPGTIVDILPDEGIIVATGDNDLAITTVQPASKSKMTARDFVNGYRIKSGDTFS
jgi:methionyl-tRNA formyltransferase